LKNISYFFPFFIYLPPFFGYLEDKKKPVGDPSCFSCDTYVENAESSEEKVGKA
jgi:hypothetical protein